MCETGFVFSSKSLLSFLSENFKWLNRGYQWLQEVWIPKLRGGGGGGGGKKEGRHILIIDMSEHHVDYMNRKGGHSVIMQGGSFHRCVHQIAWTREWCQCSGKL